MTAVQKIPLRIKRSMLLIEGMFPDLILPFLYPIDADIDFLIQLG